MNFSNNQNARFQETSRACLLKVIEGYFGQDVAIAKVLQCGEFARNLGQ
jgi:hypothetical protein